MSISQPPSDRVRLRRLPELGSYDRATIHSILDQGTVAHVGILDTADQPVVLPMAYARLGEELVLHGSVASRLLRSGGTAVSCAVTLADGLIVARSLFESSLRYRSVVIVGVARRILDPVEHRAALLAISEHLIPGRAAELREPTARELAQTAVLAVPLTEASAKVSDGFSQDDPEDIEVGYWAGVVPWRTVAGAPIPHPELPTGTPLPPSIARLVEE